jgi:magnesium-protoporphyrin O-methyltransferase
MGEVLIILPLLLLFRIKVPKLGRTQGKIRSRPNYHPESMNTTTNDKAIVKDYFNATGFDRWRRIYGDGEVNKVQKDIRIGHQQTIDTVIEWLKADENLSSLSVCDAGCGVGSLSIPLAQEGAKIFASDISEKNGHRGQRKGAKNLKRCQ